MAATLVEGPFDHPGWIFEPKLDGLRVLGRFDGRDLTLLSRNDRPQEAMFPDVAAALRGALAQPAVVDGEVVCFDDRGRTSFRALQQRFHLLDPAEIQARAERYPAYIFLFDLLWLAGRDLTGEPLSERKRLLREAVRWSDRVLWTGFREREGKALFRDACRRGEEGIIGKLLTSPYVGRRDPAWVKVKCLGRQEFVIGGFTDPQRSRVGLGALLVGYYEGDRLVYAGKVGTGYTREVLLDLRRRLDRLARPRSPFEEGEPPAGPGVHWARPELVAEVAFAEWTQNGLLRQPRFEGLRADKDPRDCRRERPRDTERDVTEAPLKGLAAGTRGGFHTPFIREARAAAALSRTRSRDQLEPDALNKYSGRCARRP
jgi:bifunctional non-homologous end joining protein LigD